MTKARVAANLAERKTALADKYRRLAKISNSKPRAARLLRQSARFRRQASTAAMQAKQA